MLSGGLVKEEKNREKAYAIQGQEECNKMYIRETK